MSVRDFKKLKWHNITACIILILITISFFSIQGNNSAENPLQSMSAVSQGVSISMGISYGTQMCIDVGSVLATEINSEMLLTAVPIDSQATLVITELFSRFDQISCFSIITLATLSFKLYKLLHSSKEQKEGSKNRCLIKTTITDNPGISLRGLSRSTGLAIGSTQYWLRILQQNNEVDTLLLGKSKHYFNCQQQMSLDEKLFFSLLQNKRIREILEILYDYPSIRTQKEICTRLGLNKSLLSYYVKILKKHSIINNDFNGLSISSDVKHFFERLN